MNRRRARSSFRAPDVPHSCGVRRGGAKRPRLIFTPKTPPPRHASPVPPPVQRLAVPPPVRPGEPGDGGYGAWASSVVRVSAPAVLPLVAPVPHRWAEPVRRREMRRVFMVRTGRRSSRPSVSGVALFNDGPEFARGPATPGVVDADSSAPISIDKAPGSEHCRPVRTVVISGGVSICPRSRRLP